MLLSFYYKEWTLYFIRLIAGIHLLILMYVLINQNQKPKNKDSYVLIFKPELRFLAITSVRVTPKQKGEIYRFKLIQTLYNYFPFFSFHYLSGQSELEGVFSSENANTRSNRHQLFASPSALSPIVPLLAGIIHQARTNEWT